MIRQLRFPKDSDFVKTAIQCYQSHNRLPLSRPTDAHLPFRRISLLRAQPPFAQKSRQRWQFPVASWIRYRCHWAEDTQISACG